MDFWESRLLSTVLKSTIILIVVCATEQLYAAPTSKKTDVKILSTTLVTRAKTIVATLTPDDDFTANSAIRKELDSLLDQALTSVPITTADVYTEIAIARRWVAYLAALEKEDRAGMLVVAKTQPTFIRKLMFAMHKNDKVTEISRLAVQMNNSRSKTLARFPNLAAAVCVVHDEPLKRDIIENSTAAPKPLEIFDYYSQYAKLMVFDPRSTPPEMLIWVVDTTNPISEMKWALKKYKGNKRVGKFYFDIRYDKDHFYHGVPKRVTQAGYSLPNIQKFGGVCADQAFYAMSVGKAIGVPTAMPKGESAQVFHAWVGYVHRQGRKTVWDFNTGRYRAYKNLRGTIVHPQTRETMADSFVSLTAGLLAIDDAKRHHAFALTDAMKRLETKLERETDKSEDKDATPNTTLSNQWINLFDAVLVLNHANLRVWTVVGEGSRKGVVSLAHKKHIANRVLKIAGNRYPDFTLAVLTQLIVSVKDIREKERLWAVAIRMFSNRPELAAEIAMARAKMWAVNGDTKRAGIIYNDVVRRFANAGPYVIDALKQTEEQLIKLGRKDAVLVLYENTLKHIHAPGQYAQQFRKLSNWHRVATIYHDRLTQAGKSRQAAVLQKTIDRELGRK